jgi:hypothetical protein
VAFRYIWGVTGGRVRQVSRIALLHLHCYSAVRGIRIAKPDAFQPSRSGLLKPHSLGCLPTRAGLVS